MWVAGEIRLVRQVFIDKAMEANFSICQERGRAAVVVSLEVAMKNVFFWPVARVEFPKRVILNIV